MQRNPTALADRTYDVLVIGGGAFGAAAARDAALRGLRTALIERGDFGGATSAECFKMVHGGIRYLQHADVPRLRASCFERSALLRIAPHLVHPLPIAIPTYGRGRRGRAFLGAGAAVYDLLTIDRNRGIRDPSRQVQRSRLLSRTEVLDLFPHLQSPDLSGAVVFEDGQMYNPARVVLGFVRSAATAGADVCNYVEAQEFVWEGNDVRGALVRDQLSGEQFPIRARVTLNAAGPWADYLHRDPQRFNPWERLPFSRDAYFIVDRAPTSSYGLAIQGTSRDKDALLGRATRHLFAAPWRDKTLLGVWHRLFPDFPDEARVAPQEIDEWIAELNTVYPALALSRAEVTFAHCGLVPFGETATATELSFGKQSRLIDHRSTHGIGGLVSLAGIRFTMARADAGQAVDLLLRQLGRIIPSPATAHMPLPGGDVSNFAAFEAAALKTSPAGISLRGLQALLRNHGTLYRDVLKHEAESSVSTIDGTMTLRAEISYAVDEEMAVHLDDVVLRRTDLGSASHPGRAVLATTAAEIGRKLAWSSQRMRQEIESTAATLAKHLAHDAVNDSSRAAAAPHAANGAMLADDRENRPIQTSAAPLQSA
jgi:glycerol-3-phosphate dehydrogenase